MYRNELMDNERELARVNRLIHDNVPDELELALEGIESAVEAALENFAFYDAEKFSVPPEYRIAIPANDRKIVEMPIAKNVYGWQSSKRVKVTYKDQVYLVPKIGGPVWWYGEPKPQAIVEQRDAAGKLLGATFWIAENNKWTLRWACRLPNCLKWFKSRQGQRAHEKEKHKNLALVLKAIGKSTSLEFVDSDHDSDVDTSDNESEGET